MPLLASINFIIFNKFNFFNRIAYSFEIFLVTLTLVDVSSVKMLLKRHSTYCWLAYNINNNILQ